MEKRIAAGILIAVITFFSSAVIAPVGISAAEAYGPYRDTKGEGKAIVEDLLARRPPENTEILGLLKIRPAEGAMIEVPIKMQVRVSENGWEDIYQTQPVLNRPGEILIIKHTVKQPNEYLYAKYQDAKAEPTLHPITGEELNRPLAMSDFALSDLGLEFLHWPAQKIVKKEMRKGRSCRVVESVNPKLMPGSYSRVLSWLDLESGNIIRAEAYDARNRELKEFSIKKVSRNEGRVQVKEMEITNEQTESRTGLEFNLEVAEEHPADQTKQKN
jgi:hypothetical protein